MKEKRPEYGEIIHPSAVDRFRMDLIVVLREIRDTLEEQNALTIEFMAEKGVEL